jgi:uncharacterized protein (TIGR02246 family)
MPQVDPAAATAVQATREFEASIPDLGQKERPMMSRLGLAVAVLALACGSTGSALAKSNEGSIRSDLVNEGAIRELYSKFTAAWNKHDVKAMAAMWAIDGDHVEPDGRVAKGREAVTKLLAAQHTTVFKNSKLALTIEDVWFITGDVALVDGSYEVTGIRAPDGKEIPPRKGHLTAVLLKEQNSWWIAASRLMIPAPLPYKKD